MKEYNINKVDPQLLLVLIEAVFRDYSAGFNNLNPTKKVGFNTTLTPAKISIYDVLIRQGKAKTKEELEKQGVEDKTLEVRYLRVSKYFENIKFIPPLIEQFKPGFIYQKLDPVNKSWEEVMFEEGDTPPTQEDIDETRVRVAQKARQQGTPIYQQSITLKDQKEVLNDRWWKRILYLDLINTLMAKGIEYGEVLGLMKRGEEEKAVLARELGDNAKEVLEANKIVIRKEMPKPLSPEDKEYVEHIKKEKAKLKKK